MLALGGGQWKLNLRLAGEALGRTNDAEQLLIDYDHEAALARKAIGAGAARAPSRASPWRSRPRTGSATPDATRSPERSWPTPA